MFFLYSIKLSACINFKLGLQCFSSWEDMMKLGSIVFAAKFFLSAWEAINFVSATMFSELGKQGNTHRRRNVPLIFCIVSFKAYGGLRGAVSFSLAIIINEDHVPKKNILETTTIAVVFFTVFVQVSFLARLDFYTNTAWGRW